MVRREWLRAEEDFDVALKVAEKAQRLARANERCANSLRRKRDAARAEAAHYRAALLEAARCGCYGEADAICIDAHPGTPNKWCPACIAGAALDGLRPPADSPTASTPGHR